MKCNDNESQNEMTIKIEIVGGWGGFPPIKRILQKIEMKKKVRMKCNDNESQNEMTIKVELWGVSPPLRQTYLKLKWKWK